MHKKLLLSIFILFFYTELSPQSAIKVLADDGSVIYLNTDNLNQITFEDPLAIGDSFQGGIIFYLDDNGQHGLIAAEEDINPGTKYYWGAAQSTYNTTNAYGTAIGTGAENTERIVGREGTTQNYPAKLCSEYVLNGYDDWYLPSKEELKLLYSNRITIGNFYDTYYWTSSELSTDNYKAWAKTFSSAGYETWSGKNNKWAVRPIRAF